MSVDASVVPVSQGEIIGGKYRVEAVIGIGGMAVVVAATHVDLGTKVAVKLLQPEAMQNQETVQRFLREARSMAKIRSEHIVRIIDVGTDRERPFIVMEHLAGMDLNQVLAVRGPMPVRDAVDAVLQGCEALAEAHANGIIHRDLKPSNFFLTRRADRSPLVKILDFGLAKPNRAMGADMQEKSLTSYDGVMGTATYMSPEQIRSSKDVDARADVWSLAVVLFELLSKRHPFEGAFLAATLAKILGDPPTRLTEVAKDAPYGLEDVLMRALVKDRDQRLASVAAFAEALAPFASPEGQLSIQRICRTLVTDTTRSPQEIDDAMTAATFQPTMIIRDPAGTPRQQRRAAVPSGGGEAARFWMFWGLVAAVSLNIVLGGLLLSRKRKAREEALAAASAAAALPAAPVAPATTIPQTEPELPSLSATPPPTPPPAESTAAAVEEPPPAAAPTKRRVSSGRRGPVLIPNQRK
jgi:eukaryotic-like serine/threonine-protein kinase